MNDYNYEPAFPCGEHTGIQPYRGMTLRDYFAAKAMQAYIMYPEKHTIINHEKMAEVSYKSAEAMLKARQQGSDEYDDLSQ